MIILNRVKANIISGKVGFNTLIIGGNQKAIDVYLQMKDSPKALGNFFKGFIYSNLESANGMSKYLPQLGNLAELESIIDEHGIEAVSYTHLDVYKRQFFTIQIGKVGTYFYTQVYFYR